MSDVSAPKEPCISCEGTGRQKDGFSEQTLEFSYGNEDCLRCRGTGLAPE